MEDIKEMIVSGEISTISDLLREIPEYDIKEYAEDYLEMIEEQDCPIKDISDFSNKEVLDEASTIFNNELNFRGDFDVDLLELVVKLKSKYFGHYNLMDKLEKLLDE